MTFVLHCTILHHIVTSRNHVLVLNVPLNYGLCFCCSDLLLGFAVQSCVFTVQFGCTDLLFRFAVQICRSDLLLRLAFHGTFPFSFSLVSPCSSCVEA